MSASYSFGSQWRLPVAPQRAWDELVRALAPGAGPRWWPGFALAMAPRRMVPGERMVIEVRGAFGYRLRMRLEITEVDPGRAIAASSDGDLRGSGRIEIRADGDAAGPTRPEAPDDAQAAPGGGVGTIVEFFWDVETRRAWMNASAWLLRPAFERAHARVMRRGEEGFRAALGTG